jgi:hypothetical protein
MTEKIISRASAEKLSAAAPTPTLIPAQRRFAAVLGSYLAERWADAVAAPVARSASTSTGSLAPPEIKT